MKVALLSDIHSNYHALEAVVRHMRREVRPDQVICLGDVVGYNAYPQEVVQRVMAEKWLCLMGNHDEAVVKEESAQSLRNEAYEVVQWSRSVLERQELRWLAKLPYELEPHDIYSFRHASFQDQSQWPYVRNAIDARAEFAALQTQIGFYGHTHRPKVFRQTAQGLREDLQPDTLQLCPEEGKVLINIGSVGQPRDGDPRASYSVLDLRDQSLVHHRITYDFAAAAEGIRSRGLPRSLGERLAIGA